MHNTCDDCDNCTYDSISDCYICDIDDCRIELNYEACKNFIPMQWF